MSRGGSRPGAGRKTKVEQPIVLTPHDSRCREPLGNIGFCANTVPCSIHPKAVTTGGNLPSSSRGESASGGVGRTDAKKSKAIVDVMEKAAAATAAHADTLEAMIPARERELRQEIQRLREANRRLQAEPSALERDKVIIELRRLAAQVTAENDLLKAENAALKTLTARPTTEHVDAVGIPLAGGKGKVTIGELRPMIQKGFGKLRERVQKVSDERFGCAGPGRCGRIGCQHT